MRILYYTRHSDLGASSRYRSIQFFDAMTERGHSVRHRPFFSNAYLRAGGRMERAARVAAGFTRRLWSLAVDVRWAEVIVVEKETLPHAPAWIERLIPLGGRPVVYDFDDAIWRAHSRSRMPLFARWMARKTERLVRHAASVVAGSRHLRDSLVAWTSAPVSLVPTTVPGTRYRGQGLAAAKTIELVWIGSSATARHLRTLFPVLEVLHDRHGYRVRAIGFPTDQDVPGFVVAEPWSSATEIAHLASGRVGIMPLPDEPFERGKCSFKLIQYMGLGLPTIASPVGENRHVVAHGITGFHASTDDQWIDAVQRLVSNPTIARVMGEAGYTAYQQGYTTESAAEALDAIYRRAFDRSLPHIGAQ